MAFLASIFPSRGSIVLRVLLFGLPTGAVAAGRPDLVDDTVATFFRPFQHDQAVLSPDGRHVALTEQVRDAPAAIVVITVDDRSTRRYVISSRSGGEHAVQQLQWAGSGRIVFTTRSRSVGAIELDGGEVKALLLSHDLDRLQPDPLLGPRSYSAFATADMPADPRSSNPVLFKQRQDVSVDEVLGQAHATGDLFDSESKRDTGRALWPFLRGTKPGSPSTVLLELRGDGDLLAYRRGDRKRLTVPSNVYIAERNAPPPVSPADLGGFTRRGDYATYDIDFLPPPLAVLELDTVQGRTREIAKEPNWRRVWLDHQGRVRLALEQQGDRYRYLYRGIDDKKWVPLDMLMKAGPSLGFTVRPENLLAERSVPLGFDPEGRTLFIASNVGSDTFCLRALDLAEGRLEELEVGHERYDLIEPTALTADEVLRLDPHTRKLAGLRYAAARRHTHWIDPELAALQASLNQQLAPQRCELLDWTADRTRFLVETSAPDDPGGFLVVDVAANKIIRCGERAPWLTAERRNPSHEFDFATADGRRLAGFLTLPREPRLNPPPVLVYFHDGPWFSDSPGFNRGAQALAALGFAVLQLNHRGSSGLGRAHLTTIDGGLDRAALEDVRAMLAHIGAGKVAVNPRLAAAFGNGMGGYLAVRMVQLAPETFRCAVAINAPGDLDVWRTHPDTAPTMLADLREQVFGTDRDVLRAQSAVAAAPATTAPVLVVHGTENAYVPVSMGRQLYRALKGGSDETAYLELPGEGHSGWSDQTTARLFAELGRFFNATIYTYDVEIQTPEVLQ